MMRNMKKLRFPDYSEQILLFIFLWIMGYICFNCITEDHRTGGKYLSMWMFVIKPSVLLDVTQPQRTSWYLTVCLLLTIFDLTSQRKEGVWTESELADFSLFHFSQTKAILDNIPVTLISDHDLYCIKHLLMHQEVKKY